MNKEETIGALRKELAAAKRRVEILDKSIQELTECGPVVLQVADVLVDVVQSILEHRKACRFDQQEANKTLWGVADELAASGWAQGKG